MKTQLTDDEKRTFYRDGYLLLEDIIPSSLVETAQARYRMAQKGEDLTHAPEYCDLINQSPMTPIMNELMGNFDPVSGARHIVRKRGQRAGDHFAPLGYRDRDLPYYGVDLHVDGQALFQTPQERVSGSPEEIYNNYIATGPKGAVGRVPENIGVNYSPLFHDPDMTNSMGGFTAFVFVCLSDQTMEGGGQTNVLKGGHHAVEAFFREQYAKSGRIGMEAPDWPRLNHDAPNGCGFRFLPDKVMDQFIDGSSETTPDGRPWPRPTPIYMKPGDAAIAMYHIPHGGTRNENGLSARKSPIFTLVNKKRHPNLTVVGNSDHPDRKWDGGFHEFPDGNTPYQRSKYALLNMYHEWDGMQKIVAEEREKAGESNEVFQLDADVE